jgi:hypothetical protein
VLLGHEFEHVGQKDYQSQNSEWLGAILCWRPSGCTTTACISPTRYDIGYVPLVTLSIPTCCCCDVYLSAILRRGCWNVWEGVIHDILLGIFSVAIMSEDIYKKFKLRLSLFMIMMKRVLIF